MTGTTTSTTRGIAIASEGRRFEIGARRQVSRWRRHPPRPFAFPACRLPTSSFSPQAAVPLNGAGHPPYFRGLKPEPDGQLGLQWILLFVATNVAVLVVLSVVLLTARHRLDSQSAGDQPRPQRPPHLLRGGRVCGLADCSRCRNGWRGARWVCTSSRKPANADEAWLVNTVRNLAQQAGIGIAFGGRHLCVARTQRIRDRRARNSALVAVSTGLLGSMSRAEVEAVLGHEVSHVANGDMVTLALIQGREYVRNLSLRQELSASSSTASCSRPSAAMDRDFSSLPSLRRSCSASSRA